ncbi:dipicolinate synthase subunit DpsA [Herbivorax sp. ANBcel31]|uniref:dipicolinate synthase subunit DpsA n=1 Tax=Herbivorax sp. ANBcel31 TaxID=3069754 RepID=UPI0027AE1F7A|nr:dipicolinate synthase subunit DpsA [Herbivorax sp. ANBcel31]MDQ2085847.1 dipicolinate synthase subunit DpsA [Herbivorax sp. ANBcel31]
MNKKRYGVLGGDLRSAKLAELIRAQGDDVSIYGFEKSNFDISFKESENIDELIKKTDVIIGPLPCSYDNKTLNAPYHQKKIYIEEIFKKIKKEQLFIAGKLGEEILKIARENNVNCIDLLKREEMAVLNSIPTAEGAIQIAMEEMVETVHGSKAVVLGFGRIGKILAKMLNGIGADVYVEARKHSDIAWIRSYGYTPVPLNQLSLYLENADVIFNTIPYVILNMDMLKKVKKNCIIIDLASKPGGVDFEKAKEYGIKTVWALSLPGKVAPLTAAGFLKDTVNNIVNELEG